MRSCEECTKCCELLHANVYGHEFGNGIPCKFLEECECKIYRVRPEVCRNYYCAWAQELIPYEMRPDKCGILISVEKNENGNYLRVVADGDQINTNILSYLKDWSTKTNTPIIYRENNSWRNINGTNEL
jgi:Fe-S-cluster containining protein